LNDYLVQNSTKKVTDFVLYLDSRPIPALDVRRVSVTGDNKDKLRFDLRSTRNDDDATKSSQPTWDKLLGSPRLCLNCKKTVPVTVGLDGQPVDTTVKVDLVIIPKMWGGIGLFIVLVVSVGLVVLVWKSDVLKDPDFVKSADGTTRKLYSLSRVQLAIWFWAIFSAYVFIWVVNGETGSLTGQVLGILGISSATLAGSAIMNAQNTAQAQTALNNATQALVEKSASQKVIDTQLSTASDDQKKALTTVKTTLDIDIANLNKQISQIQPLPQSQTSTQPRPTIIPFLTDILSDGDAVSLPRFQACAWTLVTIIIFLSTVWQTLSMPQFDGYMLSLMGLSSTTYVGMKATEKLQLPATPVKS
jgi:hypothetical protein